MTIKKLPLHNLHQSLNAEFTEEFGCLLPSVYTSVAQEYEACTEAVGILDRSCWTVLKVVGNDSVDLLHRLTTNDLVQLRPGMVTSTVFTNEQARIVDLVSVHRHDDFLLLVASPRTGERLTRWVEKFTFTEEVKVEDKSETMGIVTLIGPGTDELLGKTLRDGSHAIGTNRCRWVSLPDTSEQVLIAPALELGKIGVNIVCENSLLTTLWNRLLEQGRPFKALPVGWRAFDALRVEKGIPLSGREITDAVNPLEANLFEGVSFTKGCYVGQEVIARLDTYKKLQKRLCRILVEKPLQWSSAVKADVFAQDEKIGWITSLASSPGSEGLVGLAYIRTRFLQSGLEVIVKADGEEARAQLQGIKEN